MECIEFLQWALPKLRMRWPGFRKVRRQVCKRISCRIKELGLKDFSEYRSLLNKNPDEWPVMDRFCGITISRFYRDRGVFDYLAKDVLPSLAAVCGKELRVWCIGCASGEEPYTLSLAWQFHTSEKTHRKLIIVATDANPEMLKRARTACYRQSSLRELPGEWLLKAFAQSGGKWFLKNEYRENIRFIEQDIRTGTPRSKFHLVLCRNLVFTYYDDSLQREILDNIIDRIHTGGVLVTGKHESPPDGFPGIETWSEKNGVYRKVRADLIKQSHPRM
jgi:chemotaxis protein methyltransferase CheR